MTLRSITGLLLRGLLLSACFALGCRKIDDGTTKTSAPLRSYVITARLDNKQAGTDSHASGLLKGSYSEKTKLLDYSITYDSIAPTSIRIEKGAKGTKGTLVAEFQKTVNQTYASPLNGQKNLTSLEERDMLKGLWFISMSSAGYPLYEIRGVVTVKLK